MADEPLTILGNSIRDLDGISLSEVEASSIGLLRFTLTRLNPIRLTVEYNGAPVPPGCMPISGAYPMTKFDIDLGFTNCAPSEIVEIEYAIAAAVDAIFIPGHAITSADDNADLTLAQFARAGDGPKLARVACKRLSEVAVPFAYNIGVIIGEEGYSMPTYWDPKIKNNG